MDQLPEITREVQGSGAGIGQNVAGILVRKVALLELFIADIECLV
jgi:hypothetical protein